MGSENDVLRQMTNPERITPQVGICDEDSSFYVNILPGDFMYKETDREFVSTRKLPREEMDGKAIENEKRPIHRSTYFKTPQGAYIHHSLHLKNLDNLKNSAHLFYFKMKFNEN